MSNKKESPEATASREEKTEQYVKESLERATAATGIGLDSAQNLENGMKILLQSAKENLRKFTEFQKSEEFKRISEAFQAAVNEIGELSGPVSAFAGWLKSSLEYGIYLQTALDDLKDDYPEIGEYSLAELFDEDFEDNGVPIGKLYKEAEERARERFETDKSAQTPNITALTARKYIAPIGTVYGFIAGAGGKKLIGAGRQEIRVGDQKQKNGPPTPVYVIADISLDSVPMTKGGTQELYSLSAEEQAIFNGVNSILYEARRTKLVPAFTLDSLYKTMTSGSRATQKTKDELLRGLRQLRNVRINRLDITDELASRKIGTPRGFIKDGDRVYLEDVTLLNWYKMTKESIGGKKVELYIIDSSPFLDYALETKQIVITDRKNVTICRISKVNGKECLGNPVNMTLEKQAIVAYLIRRIEIMRRSYRDAAKQKREYDKKRERNNADPTKAPLPERTLGSFRDNQHDTILMQTLFKETETESTDKNENKRTRDFVFLVLDNFRLRGLIAGYKKRTQGRVTTAIEIQHTIDTAEESEKEA